MTEFYQWAAAHFLDFVFITFMFVMGLGYLIEKIKERPDE